MRHIAIGGIVAALTVGSVADAGAAVLYQQQPIGELATPAAPSHDSADATATDDFTIGDGQVWQVQRVEAAGKAESRGAHTASVSLYADAGSHPGGLLFTQAGIPMPPCDAAPSAPQPCNLSLPLTGAPSLAPGTYWLVVRTSGESVWHWHVHTPDAAYGAPALWQSPNSNCVTWTVLLKCNLTSTADGKDLVFALQGALTDSRFTIARLSAKRLKLFARTTLPAAGTMRIGGKGVKKASKELAAGEQRLRVSLKAGVRERLRSGRKARVRVALTFTAAGGDAYSQETKAKLVPQSFR
jgi:hypothetical protein